MLYLSTKLNNLPLLSLRHSGLIGSVIGTIINPHNLHIDGFYCLTPRSKDYLILLDISIREFSLNGIIINDLSELSEPNDLVRLKSILELNFHLIDKPVMAAQRRIGKVAEYAIDKDSLFIQKLYVQPPVWQSLNQNRLIIDRSNILEVTDKYIIVQGPEAKDTIQQTVKPVTLTANYSASTSLTSK